MGRIKSDMGRIEGIWLALDDIPTYRNTTHIIDDAIRDTHNDTALMN